MNRYVIELPDGQTDAEVLAAFAVAVPLNQFEQALVRAWRHRAVHQVQSTPEGHVHAMVRAALDER